MSATIPINLNQNEIGAFQNDGVVLVPGTMAQGTGFTSADIPSELTNKGATTIGTGIASGFNATSKTFVYNGGAQCPQPGSPDLLVAVPIVADVQNGFCVCPDQVSWVCIRLVAEPVQCSGYTPGTITTIFSCANGFNGVTTNQIVASAPTPNSWSSGNTIFNVTGGGASPAGGNATWDQNGITGYTPTSAEFALAAANGGTVVCLIADVYPPSPNDICGPVQFKVNVIIEDPCNGVEFANVDFA